MKRIKYYPFIVIFMLCGIAGEIVTGWCKSPDIESAANQMKQVEKFIKTSVPISPIEILDAEKLIEQAKNAERMSDSLLIFHTMMADSEFTGKQDSLLFQRLMQNSLSVLSLNLTWLPDVRRIQRHLKEMTLADIHLVFNALWQQSREQYFEAKTKNPYANQVSITKFQNILNKLIQRKETAEKIQSFCDRVREIKWLGGERGGYHVLMGQVHQHFKEWEKAFSQYKNAYQVVGGRLLLSGIDSSFAVYNDSVASKAFVAHERKLMAEVKEQEALELLAIHDSLRLWHNFFANRYEEFTKEDSQITRRLVEKVLPYLQAKDKFSKKRCRQIRLRKYQLILEDLDYLANSLFVKIEAMAQLAKQLDPFNKRLRISLGYKVFYNTAISFGDSSLFQKAVDEFERLVWTDKGLWANYFRLGDACMGTKNWLKAFDNYKQAEIVLKNTTILSLSNPEKYFSKPDSIPVNKKFLAYCLWRQAGAKIKMYAGKEALELLRLAYDITPVPTDKVSLQKEIDEVDWDDGNVYAMNLKHRALAFGRDGEIEQAKAVNIELLKSLWTQRTKDEIGNIIAMYDFQQLNNKEAGIERLRKIVAPMKKDTSGSPLNSVNDLYFKNYGYMCYYFGNRYLVEQDNRKMAYIYFTQATQIMWDGRSKGYMQLASLSDFNALESIDNCYMALKEAEHLLSGEKRQIAELLSKAYQKQAKYSEAKLWYNRSLDKAWCENRPD